MFDEPLSNFAAELRVEILRLHKDLGATMIYVTHDQVEAMTLAAKIVALRAGIIEQVGTQMQLYQAPDNVFAAGLIGSPSMDFLKATVAGTGKVRAAALGDREIETSVALPAEGKQVIVGLRPQDLGLHQETTPIGRGSRASRWRRLRLLAHPDRGRDRHRDQGRRPDRRGHPSVRRLRPGPRLLLRRGHQPAAALSGKRNYDE